ncbi:e3 SUMO-protein ligase RanBP2 [Trichonephila inaurata madagascariensis]|uniref:Nuclear pore complex protein Nup153 n=1 Tax=Trichonephila inaurata madagascariensis TaxID=2747483 RepID=A0A8X7C359_9ARAC|nr:e3 SUMO-protein ligase RanBP2 [Trichonephila inaurata madagascariensis]
MISSGFRTKKDVERHVADALSRLNSENEKNLRGYTFARLFFQVKDYEAAKKHLSSFLSVRDNHASAHRLMAQICEATNNPESALQSYKRALEIDPHQIDIVLKICELYCQLSVDHETARYWADRADQLYPHNEIVFKLRECMVSAEGEPDHKELENLIAAELAAQPKNVGLRIRLLRLYLDTERLKDAYDHATLIEGKRLFPYSVEWYYLLGDIFEAYQEENGQNLDSQFYINYLTALDRLILLTLAEPHSFSCENGKKQYNVNDAAAVLLTFDQLLKKASEKDIKEGSWLYFMHYMKGQLYFYMTSLLLKRVKMDQGNKKESFRFGAGLAVVCYTYKPLNLLQEIWFSNLEDNQKAFTNFFQQSSLRTSFIGHVITDMCKEDKSKWLQKLKLEVCIPQVKERIYSRIFSSVVKKDKLLSSYFILDSTFENCSLEFPSESALQEYDKAAYKLCPDSLHHLVWLEMQRFSTNSPELVDNINDVFKGLQYSNKNLTKGSCESLCVLDLEAYLYASVYQTQSMMEKKKSYLSPKNQDSQLSYPPDIADAMCTKQQASWWKAAYGLHTCSIKEKLGEYRRVLQHGLEVIRGIGNHGMEVQLVVSLARKFAFKADKLIREVEHAKDKKKLKPDNVKALQQRAIHYWNVALGMLDKMSSGQTLKLPKEQVFSGLNKTLSRDEIKDLQDDGQIYIAVYLMDTDKLDEAAEILSKLSNPYGSYYLALILKKMASQEEKFSNTKTILLTKAKNSLHDTMDRIKDDKSHPLNKEIYIVLEDIENELATELSVTNSRHVDDADETDSYDASSELNNSIYLTPSSYKTIHSTPRPSSQFLVSKSRIEQSNNVPHKHFEPSPERLDAQIRALALNQDTVVKTLLEQQKTFLETNKTLADTLKQNTEVLEQLKKLMEELKISESRNQQKNITRKLSYPKGQADEEDYTDYDPNSLLEFYTEETNEDYRNSGYTYNPSSRMVHEAAASLNYVMSPALPPGPPPALNYNYQYPPHAVLPGPPIAERAPFYHPPPGQGLPFSEGQQLPQFHFHVASPVVKPPPPIMSSVANIPQGVPLPPPPPPPVSLHPPQPVIPPPSTSLSMPSPWPKTVGVPHAFQIPLPTSAPFSASPNVVPSLVAPAVSNATPVTSQSTLKSLLMKTPPPASGLISQQQHSTSTPSSSSNLSMFTGISKTPETSLYERSRCESENAGSPDADGDLEKEVMGDFKPLIPLPAEIVVETGEEDEEVLFEDRAKLYRFVDQEWKERGLGIVKILHHNSSGRVRLLMRREQVLKVCANHYITADMEIYPLKNSDRAWTWVAQDFADEELRPEHFCIRFKTAELAAAFKTAFVKAINISKESGTNNISTHSTVSDNTTTLKSFGTKFLPKAGSWSCPTCYVSNAADKSLCEACETKNPALQSIIGNSVTSTVSSSLPVVENSAVSSVTSKEKPFTFVLPGQFQSNTSILSTKATVTVASSTPKNIFGGFTFSSSPTIRETESPEAKDREILVVSTKAKNGPQVTKINSTSSSPFSQFSFAKSPTSSVTVQVTDNMRTVTANDGKATPFGNLFPKPFSTVITSTSVQSNTLSSSNSLSKMQAMVETIAPTYTFESKEAFKNAGPASESVKKIPDLSANSTVSPNISKLSDGSPEEFEPTAEFKPVVPLPALVEIKTGEEKEQVLFEERAKLFRYDSQSKEWKERGTGVLKILFLEENQKYRILMRRDQVLKICANHYILPEMKLTPLATSDKSWVWLAQDYSDGDLVEEKFAAKFKNAEIANKFQNVFEKCQIILKTIYDEESFSENSIPEKCTGNSAAFDQLFKPTAASWNCPNCHKANMNDSSCVYCKTPKIVSASKPQGASDQKPLSELFKPAPGSWACQNCFVQNKATDNKCASCESPNPTVKQDNNILKTSTVVSSVDTKGQSLTDMFKPQPGSWECQSCYVRNNSDKIKCVSCETPKSGSSALPTLESSSIFGKFKFGSSNTSSTFQFGKPQTGEFVFGVRPVTQPTTFSFGYSSINNKENETVGFKPNLPISSAAAVFGGVTQKTLTENNETTKSTSTPIFGSFSSPTFTFGSNTTPKKPDSDSVEFHFGSPQKYEFNFTGVRPRSPVKTPKSPRSPATPSDADEEGSDSDADNIYFQPAIPLPPKVDVKTGEEDENVIFCKRAKLFRFSAGEWKERGLGDIKILFDDKTKKARLLMRREQVLKVCLNHYLTKDLKFEKRNDKSWSWTATDFSENEPSPELLAVRFKSSELAEEFKKAIDDALGKMFDSQPPSDKPISKPATVFSFKSETPIKVESNFSSGSLSSRFGTSTPDKPIFGTPNAFNFSDSKESSKTTPFSFSFKDNKSAAASTFFGQTSAFGASDTKSFPVKNTFSFGSFASKEAAPNDNDVEIVFEATAASDKIANAEKLQLPKNFYLYENKKPCPGCIGCTDTIPPRKGNSADEPKEQAPSATEPEKTDSNVLFGSSKISTFSFAALANKADSDSITKTSSPSSNIFAGAGAPVFGTMNNSTDEGNDEVVQSADIYFEPVIPLPDLIEVKTGEEDEIPIFVHRAKLFRFDAKTKQWKERGVGDIKILSHKEMVRFRIILRRDQVHNVACNHCITEDMTLSPMATSENALCWNALDFSDGTTGEASQFAVRFKLEKTVKEFKQIFDECKEKLANLKKEKISTDADAAGDALHSGSKTETPPSAENTRDNAVADPEGENRTEEYDYDKSSDEEDDADILFEKRASLEIFDETSGKFKVEGMGSIRIIYDDSVYGYHITMVNDNGRVMCDHIIAVQTCLREEGKKAVWAAIDLSVEPVVRRQFRVTFSSHEAVKEFRECFEEGKEIAIKSEIVEKAD